METPNVNNLNGVPNFGHGLDIPTEQETPSIDEVKDAPETEDTLKVKAKKK